ncbi:MAG: hypothetical protein KA715_13010 [Xanthomonadaceae bacterium]|nr:hypothetical protein [Xanthomonadaceae bacterium]
MNRKIPQNQSIIFRLEILLELDLLDPVVEAKARTILAELSELGIYRIDHQDDGCIACLDLYFGVALNELKKRVRSTWL